MLLYKRVLAKSMDEVIDGVRAERKVNVPLEAAIGFRPLNTLNMLKQGLNT